MIYDKKKATKLTGPMHPQQVSLKPLTVPRSCAWACRVAGKAVLAAILMITAATPAISVVRITNDRGGNIGTYWARYMALRDAREPIVIDGTCTSACTLVLGILPRDRICVTANAVLGFHAAWRPGFFGSEVINEPATRTLWNFYPAPIRQWIARHGGLGPKTIYLSGSELKAMYRQCL